MNVLRAFRLGDRISRGIVPESDNLEGVALMARALRIIRNLIVTFSAIVALAVGGLVVGSGTAVAEELPSCLDHTWTGNAGFIAVRTSPSGTVAWGIRDYTENGGVWNARVYVNDKLFDKKEGKTYNPHGSIPRSYAPSGAIVRFEIEHIYPNGEVSNNVPNGCIVP